MLTDTATCSHAPLLSVAAWDHLDCDRNSLAGCSRCAPQTSSTCCDLCSPHYLGTLAILSPPATNRAMKKSYIKPHTFVASDHALRSAILEWRKLKAREVFGDALPRDLGNDLFMSTIVIERIIACAHGRKLSSIDNMIRELDWARDRIEMHGVALLDMVRQFTPPNPYTEHAVAPPIVAGSSSGTAGTLSENRKRKPPMCGRCGNIGHTSAFIVLLQHTVWTESTIFYSA